MIRFLLDRKVWKTRLWLGNDYTQLQLSFTQQFTVMSVYHCPKSTWPLLEHTMTRPGTSVNIKLLFSQQNFKVHTKNALQNIWIVIQNCLTIQTKRLSNSMPTKPLTIQTIISDYSDKLKTWLIECTVLTNWFMG